MTDYNYTIQNERAYLEHVALIDRGGFGEVHKVDSLRVQLLILDSKPVSEGQKVVSG